MSRWTTTNRDSVALLEFDRPPKNFMDFASMIELGDLLEELAARTADVKVVVLTGSGGAFINHADPADLVRAGRGEASPEESGSWARALRLLEEMPQPTIAAIDGLASGGGNELALACTLRLGSERAQMQQPEVGVGIIPGGGGSVRLPRLVGAGIAAEALLSARAFTAEEALKAGWVNAVLPTERFREHAWSWVSNIARRPAPALNAAKRSIVDGSRLLFADALALEHELFTDLAASSPALKEAIE